MLIGTSSSNQLFTELRETLIHERENSLMVSDWVYITSFYKQNYSVGRTIGEATFDWVAMFFLYIVHPVDEIKLNEIFGKIHFSAFPFSSFVHLTLNYYAWNIICSVLSLRVQPHLSSYSETSHAYKWDHTEPATHTALLPAPLHLFPLL